MKKYPEMNKNGYNLIENRDFSAACHNLKLHKLAVTVFASL